MKIYIPERARQGDLGGGFTFTRNLIQSLKNEVEFINDWKDCDIFFIPGATLEARDTVKAAKKAGKKIVLRIDNIPRNSRNRNTGTGRLYDFAQMADEIVYQSNWAKSFIKPFIKKDGEVILNGVDKNIFTRTGDMLPRQGNPQYIFVRYNRDETKRWEKAWYTFQRAYFKNPEAHLWIVGRFSPQQEEYNFDLFGGAEKRYRFYNIIEDRKELAKIYRSADILLCPYFNDACSNVVAEAMACGLKVAYEQDGGGISQQVMVGEISLEEMAKDYLKLFKKVYGK